MRELSRLHRYPNLQPAQPGPPVNLQDLLRQRNVESERIEYKAGWNPDAVLRTVCAFANDFENLGGGYVVIGQDCDAGGQAVFPPVGIPGNQLDKIQRELLACCQLIQPPYFPVLTVAEVEGRNLAVLWLPGGHGLVKAGLPRLPPVSPPSTRPGTTTSAVPPARWRRGAGR